MSVNETLMWRVLDTIRKYPHRWDQRFWVNHTKTGTTYDIAGWTWIVHNGHTFRDTDPNLLRLPELARDLLGLTKEQAAELFFWTSVGPEPSRYRPWTWGKARHPTFLELVDRVAKVTGFRYDPEDRPPGWGDRDWLEPVDPWGPRPSARRPQSHHSPV